VDEKFIPLNALNKATVGALLLALLSLPYSYYMFLRWVVLLSTCLHLYFGIQRKRWVICAIFGSIAALFNPFDPVYMTKSIWMFLDLGAAALMAFGYADLKKSEVKQAEE
jgi:hypothetical protein